MSISNDLRRLRGNSKMARAVWTESKFLLSSIYIVYRNVAPIPPIFMQSLENGFAPWFYRK